MKKALYSVTHNPNFGMWIIALIFMFLYIVTAPPANVGYADSDELLTTAYHLGVAHPSGYPLYTLLLWVATHIPIPTSIAFRGHLLSIILSATTLAVVFRTSWLLIEKVVQTSKKTFTLITPLIDRWIISTTATTLLGISVLYWIYSITTEVFPLNNLIAITTIFFLLHTILTPTYQTTKRLLLISALTGLGLSHHQTFVLIIPAIATGFWFLKAQLNLKRIAACLLVIIFSAAVPQLLLLIYNAQPAPVSWHMEPSLAGLQRHVFRQEFQGSIAETGQQVSAYIPELNPEKILNTIPIYLSYTSQFWGVVAIICALIGVIYIFEKNLQVAIILSLAVVIAGPLFGGILDWPVNAGHQAIAQRQYLMAYTLFAPLIALGFYPILQRLARVLNILTNNKILIDGFIILPLAVIFLWRLWFSYPIADLSHYTTVSDTYGQMIQNLEPDAVIACFTDTSCFALLYEQAVNQKRPDVTIIPRAIPLIQKQLQEEDNLEGFDYQQEPMRTFDILTWNIGIRPVYVTDISEFYFHMLGLSDAFLFYIPLGTYAEITNQIPYQLPDYSFDDLNFLKEHPAPQLDRMRYWQAGNTIRNHIVNSSLNIKYNRREFARQELNLASTIYLTLDDPKKFEKTRNDIELGSPDERYIPGAQPISLEEFDSLITQWKDRQRLLIAHKLAMGAAAVYPREAYARILLARSYTDINDINAALREYDNALRLDPTNTQAQEEKEALETSPPTENLEL